MALSDKTKRIMCIIMDSSLADPALENEMVGKLLNVVFPSIDVSTYAFAFHNLDTHAEDKVDSDGNIVWRKGDFKTPHFHVWAECRTTRRISTYINKIAEGVGLSTLCVSVEVAQSMEGCVQYLIHKNDSDKHQYPRNSIMSNLESSEIDLVLEGDNEPWSVDYIVNTWKACRNKAEFVKKIGLSRFNANFRTIKFLTNDFTW